MTALPESVPTALILALLGPDLDLRQVAWTEGFEGRTRTLRRMAARGKFPAIVQRTDRAWRVPTCTYLAWKLRGEKREEVPA